MRGFWINYPRSGEVFELHPPLAENVSLPLRIELGSRAYEALTPNPILMDAWQVLLQEA